MRKAIAIDFDGCVCTDKYPDIGAPNWEVINRARAEQRAGAGLILWTCREGQLLLDALAACEAWGLTFDDRAVRLPAAPPVPECFQGVELIDKNAVLQRLVKYGWLKMNALEDSAEMIAVQAILYDAPTITLSSNAPLTWV